MSEVRFVNKERQASQLSLEEGESLLDGLLRSGHSVPYSCKSGLCQTCVVKIVEGDIPAKAQTGLRPAHVADNWALSCQCYPIGPLEASPVDAHAKTAELEVVGHTLLSGNVLCLRLAGGPEYRAGQYMSLWRDESVARSYSIASVYGLDDTLEFYIRHHPGGAFSDWAVNSLQVGQRVRVSYPIGSCTYQLQDSEHPLLLIGAGTGVAPLYGIARDALRQNHSDPIHLLIATRDPNTFYLRDVLVSLAAAHPKLTISFVSNEKAEADLQPFFHFVEGSLSDRLPDMFDNWAKQKVFICGSPEFVAKTRRICFLAGTPMRSISADSFAPAA